MVCVQSDKLSSPVGSLVEGLNKDPSSEPAFSANIPPVDSQGSADGNTLQFRSPLLRQMMGNKLSAAPRPASTSNDAITSAASDTVFCATDAERELTETHQPLVEEPHVPFACGSDEIAVCDVPLDPSPRIDRTAQRENVTSAESTSLNRIPIEVWTEESAVDPSLWQSTGGHYDRDDKDELCVEDDPLEPSPRLEVDMEKLETCTFDTKPDPLSTGNDHGEVDDKDDVCVEDSPLEPSPCLEMDESGKPEEHTSVVDEDRDIDTMESSEMKIDLLMDTSSWNGVEKSYASGVMSALTNGYLDDDVRM